MRDKSYIEIFLVCYINLGMQMPSFNAVSEQIILSTFEISNQTLTV